MGRGYRQDDTEQALIVIWLMIIMVNQWNRSCWVDWVYIFSSWRQILNFVLWWIDKVVVLIYWYAFRCRKRYCCVYLWRRNRIWGNFLIIIRRRPWWVYTTFWIIIRCFIRSFIVNFELDIIMMCYVRLMVPLL